MVGLYGWFFGVAIGGIAYYVPRTMVAPQARAARTWPAARAARAGVMGI